MLKMYLVPVVAILAATASQAEEWRYKWQAGQTITYRLSHDTSAAETIDGKTSETTAKVRNVKQWRVLAVDGDVATLQLSLKTLRLESTTPNGETMTFDSEKPDQSSPQLREQLGKFVGTTLAVLRVNSLGEVVEVKECNHGPKSRYDAELPFLIQLPKGSLTVGGTWKREFRITMEPPQGTGETYEAAQTYGIKNATPTAITMTLNTILTNPPEAVSDQVPLLQMQPEGEIVFLPQQGRMQRATLTIDKELKNHAGDGSSYRLRSTLTEELVP